MQSQDKDTLEVLARAAKVKETISTEGWPIILGMINRRLEEFNSIDMIPLEELKTDAELVQQITVRHGVIAAVRKWLKEIETLTGYADAYVRISKDEQDDIIVQS